VTEHLHYDEYNMPKGHEYVPLQPQMPLQELIAKLIDTREMEARYEFCKMFVDYGLDEYIIASLVNLPSDTSRIETKINNIAADYRRLEIEIREAHDTNHGHSVGAGYGQAVVPAGIVQAGETLHPTDNRINAYGSEWGVTHQQNGQWGMHQNHQYGPPQQYPPAQQHVSPGRVVAGLGARWLGIPAPSPYAHPAPAPTPWGY